MSYKYEYPRPCVTTDVIVITRSLPNKVLLIKRGNEPFQGMWAFPGGFVDMNEDLPVAALRELKEETGIELSNIEQFKTYGAVGRDPRHRTISVVYTALINDEIEALAMDDAADAKWWPTTELPPLAFDHSQILKEALGALQLD